MNQTLYNPTGYKWPEYQNYIEKRNYTGLNSGSSGVGLFLLELYLQTQNIIYLNYAMNAANWLICSAIEDNNKVKWEQIENITNYFSGWSQGAAGIGFYFIKLYKVTFNLTYFDYAIKAGNWLISEANPIGTGYKWNWYENNNFNYTGWNVGAAGIGNFFLELYQLTKNETFIEYAEGAAQWLINLAIPEKGGYKWALYETSSINSTALGSGTAGVGNFFFNLYQTVSNETYLNYAEGAAQWLISLAVSESGGYKFPIYQGTSLYYTGLTMGAAGIGIYFSKLFNQTLNATYKEYSRGVAQWLISIAYSDNTGFWWPDYIGHDENFTGLDRGVAGIGIFLIQMYNLLKNQTYYHYLNGTIRWLISQAIPENGGLKWPKSQNFAKFYTHWDWGGAGIGYFFLQLSTIYQPPVVSNGTDNLIFVISSLIIIISFTIILVIYVIYFIRRKKKKAKRFK